MRFDYLIEYYASDGEMLEAVGINVDTLPDSKIDEEEFEKQCDGLAELHRFVPAFVMAEMIGCHKPENCVGWVRTKA